MLLPALSCCAYRVTPKHPTKGSRQPWIIDNSAAQVSRCPCLPSAPGPSAATNEMFKAWGQSDVAEATRLVDICLDAGLTMFDSADVYSGGAGRGDSGPGHQGPARQGAHLHQGHLPRWARVRTMSAHRAMHLIRAVRARPASGSAPITSTCSSCTASTRSRRWRRRWARSTTRAGGQDPLHRLLEFLGLAPDEVAGGLGEVRLAALRRRIRRITRWSGAITNGS